MVFSPMNNRQKHEKSVYQEWVAGEGVPVLDGTHVRDLRAVEVAPWARKGAEGAILEHESTDSSNNCYVCEIQPGGQTTPQRQMFEEMIYVLKGRGSTTVWQEGGQKLSFEWQDGSIFAIPLNAWHQHFNGSGTESLRYLAVTNSPVVMNLFQSTDFVFNNTHVVRERFNGEPGYFDAKGDLHGRLFSTNFVPDVRAFELLDYKERGAGGKNIHFRLTGNTMGTHISEFPVGTYKKAHRHGPGAHVIILGGQGYSLMWRQGEPIRRFDWQEGSLLIPGNLMFHQHFNTGQEPARYLALRFDGKREKYGGDLPMSSVSMKEGGHQIDYEDQDPVVHQMFVESCATSGVQVRMDDFPVRVAA